MWGYWDLVHRMWNLNQRSHIPSLAGPHTVKNRAATGLRKPSWNVREALTRCSGRDVYVSLYSSAIQCRQRWKPPQKPSAVGGAEGGLPVPQGVSAVRERRAATWVGRSGRRWHEGHVPGGPRMGNIQKGGSWRRRSVLAGSGFCGAMCPGMGSADGCTKLNMIRPTAPHS